ncbi:MAG: glycosyltransferase family 4 protein, partial [Chloroflexi bacterium]|nr:glycosyltransferase family 4 protein [Chloroflexota bacterium]
RPLFFLQTVTFALSLVTILRRAPADVYYSRDPFVLAVMVLALPSARRRMFFESHTFPRSTLGRAMNRWTMGSVGGVVVITSSLRRRWSGLGLGAERLLVAPDGVDAQRYEGISREAARSRLGFAPGQKMVVYTGHLYQWKGAEVLAEAGGQLGEDVHTVIVGGVESEVSRLKRLCSQRGWTRVQVVGHVSPLEIPFYQIAADVLALPNSARAEISRTHTSPLKLFEYMAAGRPIVASDLPSLREVLRDGENALLVRPDDAGALAEGVRRVLTDAALAERLGAQARRDAQGYTWQARARRIIGWAGDSRACARPEL